MTMNTCLIFPPKTAQDPRQCDMVADFWATPTAWFKDGTGPNSEDSPCPSVTSYWCSAEGFYPTVFEHRTPVGKPLYRPWASNHNFLTKFFVGCLTEPMMPELWYKFGNFSAYGFWEKRVRSLDLSPSLVASVLIVEPNARGLHDLECLTTFLQNFSAVATS